jgi:hypothetical protein
MMTEDAGSNRIDHHRECCPWLMLTRTFRYAMGLQILLLATLGALGNTAGWRIAARITLQDETAVDEQSALLDSASKSSDPEAVSNDPLGQDVEYLGAWPGSRSAPICPFAASTEIETTAAALLRNRLVRPPADPIVSVPYRIVRPFCQLLNRQLSLRHYAYYLLGGAWTLLLWSFLGAAITRIAALQFARDERTSIGAALAHARAKLGAHLAAAAVPVTVALLGALVLIVIGFVARLSFGATLVGAFWFIPLTISILMTVVLVGLLFGWPLIWGAIDTERSDSFDGMSRAYAYAYHRPLKYLAFAAFAAIVGYAGWLLVWLVSEMVIQLTAVAVGAGAGPQHIAEMLGESGSDSTLVAMGSYLAQFWNGVIRTIASAYGFGYFWCATAGIYLLLRLDVDATELDEVSTDDAPGRFGMPPLQKDEQPGSE